MIIYMEIIQKVYQMFVLGCKGNNLKMALNKGLGGIIFFTDDIHSKEDFKLLVKNLSCLSKIKPFLSIDQEGGRVERTQNIWGGKKYLSAKFAFEAGEEFLKNQTQAISDELNEYGLNLNFAPCCDTNTNPNNPIIGERAFSDIPEDVIKGAKIVLDIYERNGIIPCIKHFPGHGDADCDSHLMLPKIDLSLEKMEKTHIKPFKALINRGVDMVMVAHLHCTCFNKEILPTSLSQNAIDYLRKDFDGVICSDDMVMQALDNYENACEMAIRAGVNLFIYRYSDDKTISIIENIAQKAKTDKTLQKQIEVSYNKIINLKQKYGLI
ncbi:MAG: glycoside hydrolase family 3 N-terminal domain-containing protein [Candidatus Gastranaerophilaceae bacterium]